MKRTKFLWIRDLPPKCRDTDVRILFERYGTVQKVRMFKEGYNRHAIISFLDVNAAVQASKDNLKYNDTPLQVEYCDSFEISGINLKKCGKNYSEQPDPSSFSKDNFLNRDPRGRHQVLSVTEQTNRTMTFRHTNGRPSNNCSLNHNQVLRSVQSSLLSTRVLATYRSVKVSNLPPSAKVSDAQLRQGLFTELRHFGQIQSVVLPSTNSIVGSGDFVRSAIVTFRRPREAECACNAIQSGEKVLFSTSVTAESHSEFDNIEDSTPRSPLNASSFSLVSSSPNTTLNRSIPTNIVTITRNSIHSKMTSSRPLSVATVMPSSTVSNKFPTRTLQVAGLTAGPTGPVTVEQLTTAFRKFGDILDVKLVSGTTSALIQFTEVRSPIRAMSAHSRDPLRLGGRPLSLNYVPSLPATDLWLSDLPPALGGLTGNELLQEFSTIAPVLELILIHRTDPNSHGSHTPSTAPSHSPGHFVTYVQTSCMEHAMCLLTELRSGKYSTDASSCFDELVHDGKTGNPKRGLSRRPFGVDFASSRQTILITNLKKNAKSPTGCSRIQIISATKPVPRERLPLLLSQLGSKQHSPLRLAPACDDSNGSVSVTQDNRNNLSSNTMSPLSKVNPDTALRKTNRAKANHPRMRTAVSANSSLPSVKSIDTVASSRDSSPSTLSTCSSSSSDCSSVSSGSSTVTSSSLSSTSETRTSPTRNCPKSSRREPNASARRTNPIGINDGRICSLTSIGEVSSDISATKGSIWTLNETCNPNVTHQPLNVVTTNVSTVLSPDHRSVSSSGGLSSPGGSSSTAITGLSCSLPQTPCTVIETLCTIASSTCGHSSLTSQIHTSIPKTPNMHSTVVSVSEFRVSPVARLVPSSASSGVSSGGRSFSSTSSNGSCANSPLIGTPPLSTSNAGLVCSKATAPVPIFRTSETKLSSSAAKGRDTVSDQSIVKLKVENSQGMAKTRPRLPSEPDRSTSVSRSSMESYNSPSRHAQTTPLTMSIKLLSPGQQVQCATLNSPSESHIGKYRIRNGKTKHHSGSHPTTPSVPSLSTSSISSHRGRIRSMDEDNQCKIGMGTSSTELDAHSTDWFCDGSPVYESMYDKIKRRTNKEAEERKQRQLEVMAAREKKWKKKKKEQATASPQRDDLSCSSRFSFSSDQSNRSFKSRSGKSRRLRVLDTSLDDNDPFITSGKLPPSDRSRKRRALTKLDRNGGDLDNWSSIQRSNRMWLCATDERSKSLACESVSNSHHIKRSREDRCSSLSSVSGEDGSNSPPGTMTRLSLGMRFPVSATYHECVRPPKDVRSKWASADVDNDSLSQVSTSSYSSIGERSKNRAKYHPRMKHSKQPPSEYDSSGKSIRPRKTNRGSHLCRSSDHTNCSDFSPSSVTSKRNSRVSQSRKTSGKRNSVTSNEQNTCTWHSSEKVNRQADGASFNHLSSKRTYDEHLNGSSPISVDKKRQRLSDINIRAVKYKQTMNSVLKRTCEQHCTPKSYFSDDATVLDSETDEIKCSDSVSYTTGTSDLNMSTSRISHGFERSLDVHSGTDDSSLPRTHSPSPVHNHGLVQPPNFDRKHGGIISMCEAGSVHSEIKEHGSYSVFLVSDRFSLDSKSTPSTEPMEEPELNEHNYFMRFSDDDWDSSIPPESPQPSSLALDAESEKGRALVTYPFNPCFTTVSMPSQPNSPSITVVSTDERIDEKQGITEKYYLKELVVLSRNSPRAPQNLIDIPSMEFKSRLKEDPEQTQQKVNHLLCPHSGQVESPCLKSNLLSKPPLECALPKTLNFSACIDAQLSNVVKPTIVTTDTCASDTSHLDIKPNEVLERHFFTDCQSELLTSRKAFLPIYTDSVHSTSVHTPSTNVTYSPSHYSIAEQDSITVQTKRDIGIKRFDEQTTPLSDSMNTSTASFPSPTDDGESKMHQVHDDGFTIHTVCSTPSLKLSPPFIDKTPCSITESIKSHVTRTLIDPPGVHDVERYVQSVIARVKAESVEQTQQAAVMTAQLPTLNQTTTPVSVSSASVSVAQLNKSTCDNSSVSQLSTLSTTSCVNKRATGSQRRPLLISTSMCSSKKPTPTVCSKWALSPTANVLSSVCVNSRPYLRSSKELFSEAISNTAICTVTSVLSRSNSAFDSHVPSIPGVNACAPLASQQTTAFQIGTATIKQPQPTVSNRLELTNIDETQSLVKCLTGNISLITNSRRRRRSEGKAVSSPYICMKEVVTIPQVSVSTSVTVASNSTSSSITDLAHCSRRSGGSKKIDLEVVQSSAHIAPQVNCQTEQSNSMTEHKLLSSTIDPYEPNFDEESNLSHSHLLHPPKTLSPSPQSCSVSDHPLKTPTTTTVTTTTVVIAVTSPASSTTCASPILYNGGDTKHLHASICSTSSTVPNTNCTPNLCIPTCTDSVDEVIRDVCAGQFDVQKYLKPLPSDVGATRRTEKDEANPMTSPNISNIPQNTSSTASVPVDKSTDIASTLPSKSFPLITSEPVVAAVTIPLSSSGATNKSNSNGSTNSVGVTPGTALINTLLAVLQSIPGSQVTVTGPAAAAGVVGNVGNGTISATTITLPVGAARQAAASIRAAVLSATSAVSSTNTDTKTTTSRVTSSSGAPDSSALSFQGIASTSRSMVPNRSTAGATVSVNTLSNPNNLSQQHPVGMRSSPVATLTTVSSNRFTDSTHSTVSLYGTVIPTAKHNVANPRKIAPMVTGLPSTSTFLEIPGLYCKLSPTTGTVRQSAGESTDRFPLLTASSTVSQPVAHPTIALTSPVPSLLQHIPHPSTNLKCASLSLSAPAVVTVTSSQTLHRNTNRNPSSASPFLDCRSPPLSTSPMSNNALHHILDRFSSGGTDPNALITLLQAAASNNEGSCRGESGSAIIDSDSQRIAYLRRLMDTHLSTDSISKSVAQHNLLESRGKPLLSRAAPSLSIPLQRMSIPVPSVTTSIFVNTISPIVSSAVSRVEHTTDSTTALISPPVPVSRQCVTPTSSQLAATGTSIPAHAVGTTYPLVWQGRLSLKNAEARVALHYIQGNPNLLEACVTLLASGGGGLPQNSLVMNGGPLRIVQRMRLEPTQLEGVQRKIQQDGASCACLAIPVGTGHADLLHQTQILNESFIRYMQEKMAAGIINVGCPDFQQGLYVVHIFPPCEFSHAQLNIAAPELHRRVVQANQSHLLVVITTV